MKRTWIVFITLTLLFCSLSACKKEPEICVDPAPPDFQNVEELFEMVRTAKKKYANGQILSQYEEYVVNLQEIPRPVVDVEQYILVNIKVTDQYIRYYYSPADEVETSKFNLNLNEYIVINYDLEIPIDVDGFDTVVKQSFAEINSDGVAYVQEDRTILFRYGSSCGFVQGTETLNDYESLLPMCEYEIVPIPGI